jgi:hypothetical protein
MLSPHSETIIVAIVTSFVGPIMVILSNIGIAKFIKYLEEKKSREKEVSDGSVNEKLADILSRFNADRVSILKFHNGSYYNSGLSMRKFSMSHETLQVGLSSDLHITQGLPVEPFSQCFAATRERGINIYKNIPEETSLHCGEFACSHHKKICCNYRNLLLGRGIWSAYLFPLIDIGGKYIGILQVKTIRRALDLDEKQIDEIKDISRTIAGALSK